MTEIPIVPAPPPVSENKSDFVRVRVTPSEKRTLLQRASLAGYSISDYIRKIILPR